MLDLLSTTGWRILGFVSAFWFVPLLLILAKWGLILGLGFVLFVVRVSFSVYHGTRIFIDVSLLTMLKLYIAAVRWIVHYMRITAEMKNTTKKLKEASTYEEYKAANEEHERLRMLNDKHPSNFASLHTLIETTEKLRIARDSQDFPTLIYDIPSLVKRNYLGIDDMVLHDHHVTSETLEAIDDFHMEITACIEAVCEAGNTVEYDDKLHFLKKLSRNIGHSALALSGGGSITMYHIGVVKSYIERGLYKHIQVISGASGGSICAAMCAIMSEEEFIRDVANEHISTDFRQDGSMKRLGIEWFPPLVNQAIHFLKTGYLIDHNKFCRTCSYYYGDITFEEAYQKTKKHICIAVTASNGGGSGMSEKLLLNHLSTPHVLIASAVAASCALPGIMKPNKLLCKTKQGKIIPFESDGSHWVDGSIGNDVPFKRMSALFSVSNFIVSQVNFHVVPFVSNRVTKGSALTGSKDNDSVLSMIISSVECDLAYRTEQLSKMKLLPRLYGQEISSVFKQKYHGHITLIPELTWDETFGVKAIRNPTPACMRNYISGGDRSTWKSMKQTEHLLCLEKCIWTSLETLLSSDYEHQTNPCDDMGLDTDSNYSNSSRPMKRYNSVSEFLMYSHDKVTKLKPKQAAVRKNKDINEIARNIARNSSYSSTNDFVGLTLSGQTTPTVLESDFEDLEDEEEEIPYGELQSSEQIQMLLEEIRYLKEQNKMLLERCN